MTSDDLATLKKEAEEALTKLAGTNEDCPDYGRAELVKAYIARLEGKIEEYELACLAEAWAGEPMQKKLKEWTNLKSIPGGPTIGEALKDPDVHISFEPGSVSYSIPKLK